MLYPTTIILLFALLSLQTHGQRDVIISDFAKQYIALLNVYSNLYISGYTPLTKNPTEATLSGSSSIGP